MRSYLVGHVGGIPISVHPTTALLAIVLIVEQGLLLGRGVPGYLLATLLVGLLFISVVLHEVGHAAMARHYGLRVSDISISPIGGVANIARIDRSSPAETLIALAGPLVNLAIAVALVPLIAVLSFTAGYSSVGDVLRGAFTGTGPIALLVSFLLLNLILTAFNLLPAYPMDGGRILRSLLTARIGRDRGTRVAVAVGQLIALALVVIAIAWQLWALIIVGVFVALAAQTEWRSAQIEQAMRRLRVGAYALWDMGGLSPGHPLTFALRGGPRDWVVTDGGRVVGMVWRHQLLRELHGGAGNRTVADIMDRDVVTADVGDSLYAIERWMQETERWAIPVTENGVYRGIFTADRFVHVRRRIAANLIDPREVALRWVGGLRDRLRGVTG